MIVIGRSEIEALVDLHEINAAIEDAYIAASAGEIELPPVGHITFPAVDGDCHIKYGHRRGDPNFVIKVATGFPLAGQRGHPTGNGVSLVISAEDGQIRAVLHDEMLLTDIRTAVGGAIATRLLARSDASRMLVIGTGIQARRQIEAHATLLTRSFDLQVWGRSLDRAERLASDVERVISTTAVADLEEACRDAEIIVTTTAATSPVINSDWIQPGAHVTAVGADAPGKHELDERLLRRADVLATDSRAQSFDHGELSVFAKDSGGLPEAVEIGELITGRRGRTQLDDITIADLTGIAAQDIAAANYILDAWATSEH